MLDVGRYQHFQPITYYVTIKKRPQAQEGRLLDYFTILFMLNPYYGTLGCL